MLFILVAITGSLITGALLFRLFFRDLHDLREAIGHAFLWEWTYIFTGAWEETWASLKLWVYLILCIGSGVLVYLGLA